MNPRRVHALMRERFPEIEAARLNWENLADVDGPRIEAIRALLERHIPSRELLVEVHRKLGAFLPADAAVEYIGAHIGEGQILVSDREFSGFVVIGVNGTGTGWSHAG